MGKHFILFGFFLLLITFQVSSQEKEDSQKLAYRSFSISPLGIYAGGNTGVYISGDINFDYGKNIFGLGVGAGTEGNLLGSNDDVYEINLLYGRSFSLNGKIFTDFFVGAGYFHFNTYGIIDTKTRKRGEIDDSTIGFPIGAKLQFRLGPRYSMGIKVGANINSLESIGTLGLVLQWNQKRDKAILSK